MCSLVGFSSVLDEAVLDQKLLLAASVNGGQPKVLDFGVARSLAPRLHTTTAATDVGQIIGTLQYMSPEQALGDTAKIDPRSDVYALGVILYELLTEQLPYDLADRSIPDAIQQICLHGLGLGTPRPDICGCQ